MRTCIVFLFMTAFSVTALAQSDSGGLVVFKDNRIDQLIRKQAEINEYTTRESRRNGPGFRIQVINTTDRNAAVQAKTKVYQLYPELKSYLLYQSPYFRLRVGNFTARKEAESYQRELTRVFKQNVFIVNDIVEVNPGKSIEP